MDKRDVKIPTMHGIESSNIAAVGYDEDAGTLHVQFRNGGHYAYPDAGKEHFNSMLKADSAGGYFHQHFRNNPDIKFVKIK